MSPISDRQFNNLKTDLEQQIKDLRTEMNSQFRESRTDNESDRKTLHSIAGSIGVFKWVGGFLITMILAAGAGELKLHERVAHLEGENHDPLAAAIIEYCVI